MASDADRIGLLESVATDQRRRNLTGNNDQRNGIHIGIGNTRNRIGGARTRCNQDDAGAAGGTGISFGCMGGASFVPRKDMP